jgi:glutamine amidotransferase
MCRWLAYSGDPLALGDLIFNTTHSLVDQSLSARSSVQTTNGDGFGVGWYDHCDEPGVYKHIQPAWNDPNLRDLCDHMQSTMFVAHVRAATDSAIQRSNCHPFRYGKWLFVHNGRIRGFGDIRRDLVLALRPDLFALLSGTTDTELMFLLALHFGMEEDVHGGIARMVGYVEKIGHDNGIEHPIQMTLGITDGTRIYAFRYSSEHESRTLFCTKTVADLRKILGEEGRHRLDMIADNARAIVSEPFNDVPDAWIEVPESSFVTIEAGEFTRQDFAPAAL